MTVQDIVNPNPHTILPDDTFEHGLATLMLRRVRCLPVVNQAGIYVGMFDFYDIWKLLLPRAALLDRESIADLAFIGSSHEEMQEGLKAAGSRPIREFLDDKHCPPVYPDTPVKEAILLLYKDGGTLPVVERRTLRFLGIVTSWEILDHLR